MDIAEATYLVPPPDRLMTDEECIAYRARQLNKRDADIERMRSSVYEARVKGIRRYEKTFANTIKDYDFKLGDLVLVRNTAIEYSHNRKMKPRNLGPVIVISRNKGGAYILAELNGVVYRRPMAAFRVIPYHARKSIDVPDLEELLDISKDELRKREDDDEGDDLDQEFLEDSLAQVPGTDDGEESD